MDIKEKILEYERVKSNDSYIKKQGNIKVMITAPHTMVQLRNNGTIKLNEPFTKAIAMYVANELNTYYLIKTNDTGIDANSLEDDAFKEELVNIVKENDIKLVIDIHGAKEDREFDVELGTLNNLSADFSTIRELEDAFHENGINNVFINEPFKGGGITQSIYGNTNADVVQVEINRKFRSIDDINKIKMICDSLIQFINQYSSYL